nr:hypothetical protein Iba_chr02eCG8080 [Ipomoea batatas]
MEREKTPNCDYMEVVIYSRSQKIGQTGTVHGLKVGGRDYLLQAAKNEVVGVLLAQAQLVSNGQGDGSRTGAHKHARRRKACSKGRIRARVSSLAFLFLSSGRLALIASSEGNMTRSHVGN